MKHLSLFFVLFLFVSLISLTKPISLLAQHNNIGIPITKNYLKKTYKAGTQNWDILQDDRGLLYFANNSGLLEFDGTSWTTIPIENKTILRSLAKKNGRIYVGGQGDFGFFSDNKEGLWSYHSLKKLIPHKHQNFADIWNISIDGESIFFQSSDKLFRYADGKITVHTTKNSIIFLSKCLNKIYVQDNLDGLLEYKNNRLQTVPNGSILGNKNITAILPYSKNTILITTLKSGIYLFDGTSVERWETSSDDFLLTNRIYSAAKLSDDLFALGTAQSGLLIIDKLGRAMQQLDKKTGLQNNTILSMYVDASKNLWLGLDNGIDYVETSSPFSLIYPDRGIEGTAYSVKIHKDHIYFGTNSGLFYTTWKKYYNPFEDNLFDLVPNTTGQVWNLSRIGKDLFLNHHEGAFQIDDGEAKRISSRNGSWLFVPLNGHKDKFIEGTYEGLYLYKEDEKEGWTFEKDLNGLDNESCRIITQDAQHNIWISHPYRGLYKVVLNEANDSITQVQLYGKEDGFPSNLYINVFKIGDDVVFTGETGIYQYDITSNRFVPYTSFNDIFERGTQIKRLKEDKAGNIWFVSDTDIGLLDVTDRGVDKRIKKIIFPELQDKLVARFEEIYPYDEYNVFFGLEKGFLHFNPSLIQPQDSSFKVHLRKVHLINEKDKDTLIYGGIYQKNLIPITYKRSDNAFRFTYSATYYNDIEQVTYRHYLDGFESHWSIWTNKIEKEYINLEAGDYTFHVQARNQKGQLTNIESYRLIIAPAWYASPLARSFYGLFVALLLIALIVIPKKQFEQEKARLKSNQEKTLQEKEAERLRLIAQSEKQIMKLKNEKLESDIQHQNKTLASSTMHLVQKNEMLNKIKTELNKINQETEDKPTQKAIKGLIRFIDLDAQLDEDWEQFALYFDQVHHDFLKRLREKYPQLTPKDQKLCAYLRMNLTTKEIVPLLNISVRGVEVSRYRLRKRLELESSVNLVDFVMGV